MQGIAASGKNTTHKVHDAFSVIDCDRQKGRHMHDDLEEKSASILNSKERAKNHQMPGTRNGKKLGQSLDDAQAEGLKGAHLLDLAHDRPGMGPLAWRPRKSLDVAVKEDEARITASMLSKGTRER
jgi:hypothetical protein